jgi:hypothetical protein
MIKKYAFFANENNILHLVILFVFFAVLLASMIGVFYYPFLFINIIILSPILIFFAITSRYRQRLLTKD